MAAISPREPKGHHGGDLTSPSASDQEDEYVVDKILGQVVPGDCDDDENMYLVRWEGYPDERCTWEPRESFLSNETLEQWERDKLQKQILSQDEINEIIRRMDVYAEVEEKRRENRRVRAEQSKKNGKSKSTASKTNQSPAQSSPHEPHGSRNSASSRKVKPHSTTRAELLSSSTTNSRAKSFQEIGIKPRAHRSSHRPLLIGPKGEPGTHFKTLSTQYRHQKAGRNEPAPDIAKIKLKSATDSVAAAGQDIAHILPSGESRPLLIHNPGSRITQVLSDDTEQLESFQGTSPSTIHPLPTPVALQHVSGVGNVQHTLSASASSVLTSISTQHRDVHYLPSGRYWVPGEVLVHLALHGEAVGDVRVGGLPVRFRMKMIALKVEHRILVDFHLVELSQYDALCRGRSNNLLGNAYITPFEDTGAALTELAESLAYNNRAALWYHPDIPYVLVAYAAASQDWRFLDGGNLFPPECQIHLALRNSMPRIETLAIPQARETAGKNAAMLQATLTSPESPMQGVRQPALRGIAPYVVEQDVTANDTHPNAGPRPLSSLEGSPTQPRHSERLSRTTSKVNSLGDTETFSLKSLTSSWLADSSEQSDDESSGSSSESIERPLSPFSFTLPSGESIDKAFQTRFGISYDYLTRPSVMPTSRKDTLNPNKARIYLAFPLSCHAEMQALRALLSDHTLPNLICTSAEPQGWDGFKTILGDKMDHRGVIIFHTNYKNYSGLAGLAKLLKMVNVNVFNLCLRQVLQYHDSPIHIERLFPNGTAILLTESSMTQQPERILAILRWFSEMVKTKRGTWKMLLIPNVRHWLRQTAIHAGAMQGCFLDILTEISELSLSQPVSYRSIPNEESEAESLDGCDDEFGKPSLVVSPANIPAYDRCCGKGNSSTELERDRVLVEWFAGWAAQNAQRHRKFPAISGLSPLSGHELDRWGHIEVVDPDKYMLQNKIPSERPNPKDSQNQSPG